MDLQEEIKRRRTFAIISHPDAGKTTLTEKLLLFGGAIQTAGAVKSNKAKTHAASDFMEIEKQRGISVATSVMGFEYSGCKINLLDTPGHKDFAEDTYRTLTAVDSVILVVDCVKGVEEQTERLMQVCRMRKTPVMIFVNKMDRPGKDPFDLMDELEEKLNIEVRPLSWPINEGKDFKGVYNLFERQLNLFEPNKIEKSKSIIELENLQDPRLEKYLSDGDRLQIREDVELIEGVYEPFKPNVYQKASLAPVFFGSALNNFGVQELLDTFIKISPEPSVKLTDRGEIQPANENFSGFVFKIHANLDPRHRDRLAFLRVCSGKFQRSKLYRHVRLGKSLRFNNPYSFFGNEKSITDDALPGDVIGLYDTGSFKIGDTLSEGEEFMFRGIPSFSPEIFREVVNVNPLKSKQLDKGIRQLTDEGVAQLFIKQAGNRKIIGTVGQLQFDVIKFRLEHEYGANCEFHPINLYKACWLESASETKLKEFLKRKAGDIAFDKDGKPVLLAESAAVLRMLQEHYPDIEFQFISEHNK